MFLNAKIHFLLQIALKVVLKSVFYISHLTNQWGQTEETIAHVYPPLRPSENLDFLLFITVLRAYKAL